MLQFWRIQGNSLAPEFQEGDFVLLVKIPFLLRRFQPGQVVVFEHPVHGRLIKRVAHVGGDGRLEVHGSDPYSIDSRSFGFIDPKWVIGRVLWHIREP